MFNATPRRTHSENSPHKNILASTKGHEGSNKQIPSISYQDFGSIPSSVNLNPSTATKIEDPVQPHHGAKTSKTRFIMIANQKYEIDTQSKASVKKSVQNMARMGKIGRGLVFPLMIVIFDKLADGDHGYEQALQELILRYLQQRSSQMEIN